MVIYHGTIRQKLPEEQIQAFCLLPPTFNQSHGNLREKEKHPKPPQNHLNSSHHQEYQVPKMEESWTLQGYFGGSCFLT